MEQQLNIIELFKQVIVFLGSHTRCSVTSIIVCMGTYSKIQWTTVEL